MAVWDRVIDPPVIQGKFMTSTTIQGKACSLLEINTGKKFWFVNDHIGQDHVVVTISQGHLFDGHVINALKDYIMPDSVILDVGSNYGQMAMEFAELAPHGTIHAFEVNPVIYECMNKTFAENGFNNIVSHPGAVWNVNDVDVFFPVPEYQPIISTAASWGVVSQEVIDAGRKISEPSLPPTIIKSFTIDSLNLDRVNIMKFDIQGSDLYGMMGAMETIKRCKPYIIFEFDSYFTSIYPEQTLGRYLEFVESIGYKVISDVDSNYLIGPA